MNRYRTFVGIGLLLLALWPVDGRAGGPASRAAPPAEPPLSRGRMAVEDKLFALPAGSMVHSGWMQRHMAEDAEGWVGKANQMSHEGYWWFFDEKKKRPSIVGGGVKAPFYHPYIERKGAPIGGEYQAHWLDAVVRLGWVGGLESCRQLGAKCVDEILASQQSDGYIGVYGPADQFSKAGPDGCWKLWAYGETLNALLCYYRLTGDPRVLEACRKAGDMTCRRFGEHSPDKTADSASYAYSVSVSTALVDLYRWTGDSKYRDMAAYMMNAFFLSSEPVPGRLAVDRKPLRGHAAGWGIWFLSAIDVYRATGETRWLDYLQHVHNALTLEHLQPHGAPSGHLEKLAGTGPDLDTELCDSFWWVWCWTEMLKLTGDSRYADFAEKAALNAMPAHRSKDGGFAAYFTTPNMLVAEWGRRYAARLYLECCHSNGPRTIPILAENMVLATPDDGLALPYFGQVECQAKLKNGTSVVLVEQTEYPFEETVRVTLKLEPRSAAFPLLVRVPNWCRNASFAVNGKKVPVDSQPGAWARLQREWRDGDRLEVTFPASIQVDFWWDRGMKRAVCVERGPLLYTLPVKGEKKIKDQWGTFAEYASADSAWNYALRLNKYAPESSIRLKKLPVPADSRVWEHAPLGLEVDAQRVVDWTCDTRSGAQTGPELPQKPLKQAEATEKILLVPYGFTSLRMTYLPFVFPEAGKP